MVVVIGSQRQAISVISLQAASVQGVQWSVPHLSPGGARLKSLPFLLLPLGVWRPAHCVVCALQMCVAKRHSSNTPSAHPLCRQRRQRRRVSCRRHFDGVLGQLAAGAAACAAQTRAARTAATNARRRCSLSSLRPRTRWRTSTGADSTAAAARPFRCASQFKHNIPCAAATPAASITSQVQVPFR